jgi:hypothetical protein
MKYLCNDCGDTEQCNVPCLFDVHDAFGKPPVHFCPVSGEECSWDEATEEPPKNNIETGDTAHNSRSLKRLDTKDCVFIGRIKRAAHVKCNLRREPYGRPPQERKSMKFQRGDNIVTVKKYHNIPIGTRGVLVNRDIFNLPYEFGIHFNGFDGTYFCVRNIFKRQHKIRSRRKQTFNKRVMPLVSRASKRKTA